MWDRKSHVQAKIADIQENLETIRESLALNRRGLPAATQKELRAIIDNGAELLKLGYELKDELTLLTAEAQKLAKEDPQ